MSEAKELAERLCESVKRIDMNPPSIQSMENVRIIDAAHQAAAMLTAQAEEIERLREALKPFANFCKTSAPVTYADAKQAYEGTK